MRRDMALRRLAEAERRFGLYVYRKADLSAVLGEEGNPLTRTLTSLCAAGIMERAVRGVYVFSYARGIGDGTLDAIVQCLRPTSISWESLESVLSKWGVISQIPIGRVTYMTTGREGEFDTRFGVIDLTHSSLPASRIVPNLVMRGDGRLPMASKMFAYENLKATGRNLHLVDMEELEWDYDEN
ncbi:type IV toxin-antitoxin system AbiEi family antitoxin [Bifidobacterium choerinum]|uniref:Transcriptional regulator n=1 Tax=Bifidobacterium choerinum TaxID=35760 RepID=A0A2D3D693_9BIFI|nr:hypothetical protein [Bifidobacterium choerinum]ATU20613.1 hypothetical protein BcFMB_06415 [Bifidobacterium choerinum]